jgi:hypothetical protein
MADTQHDPAQEAARPFVDFRNVGGLIYDVLDG